MGGAWAPALAGLLLAATGDVQTTLGRVVQPFVLRRLPAVAGRGGSLGDGAVGLADFLGADAIQPRAAVLLAFVPPLCAGCGRLLPLLNALTAAYGGRGLQVLAVATVLATDDEGLQAAQALLQPLTCPVLQDAFGLVAPRLQIGPQPYLLLAGGSGHVLLSGVLEGTQGDGRERGAPVGGDAPEFSAARLLNEIRRGLQLAASEPVPPELAALLAAGGAQT